VAVPVWFLAQSGHAFDSTVNMEGTNDQLLRSE